MELIFIRHGQGEHNLNVPDRLNIENPRLTFKGKNQVTKLLAEFTFANDDIFIVSPTIRTIETTNIITSNLAQPMKYISPLVGPRMFPLPENPEIYQSKCDKNYPIERIVNDHSDFNVLEKGDATVWNEGINTLDKIEFYRLGEKMIEWIKSQCMNRAFIISHDGTITSYRQLLGEEGLTRLDFLGEAGWYRMAR